MMIERYANLGGWAIARCGISSLVLLVLATMAPAVLATAFDGPASNTKCGDPAKEYDTGEDGVSADGEEYDGASDSDKASSIRRAKRNLDVALGTASGVVCENCSNGIQCERNQSYDASGRTINSEELQDPETGEWGWKSTAKYSGKYDVWCESC
jgi:hypothetical protein